VIDLAGKNTISIDIGTFNTKITVGRFHKGNIYVEKALMLETTKGSLVDGSLVLEERKTEDFKQNLVQALSMNKIKYRDAIFTIQSTSIIRRELDVPNVKASDMKSMIGYEIEQYLPIDLNDYIIEYKVTEEKKDNKSKILIAAMPKTMADDYIALIKSIKLEPKALDINSNAVSKLLSFKQQINDVPINLDHTIAFIDLGHSNSNILILSKGMFQFSRLIAWGGKDLTEAIADAFDVSFQEAERKKISEVDLSISGTSPEPMTMNQVTRNIISRWTEDILRIFQYYKTRNANNDINEIYLYGGTSNLRGITNFIESTASIPTKQVKTLSSVILDKQLTNIELEYYLNSIGAIIRK
jgi:type IV pilus assembly protein PilM